MAARPWIVYALVVGATAPVVLVAVVVGRGARPGGRWLLAWCLCVGLGAAAVGEQSELEGIGDRGVHVDAAVVSRRHCNAEDGCDVAIEYWVGGVPYRKELKAERDATTVAMVYDRNDPSHAMRAEGVRTLAALFLVGVGVSVSGAVVSTAWGLLRRRRDGGEVPPERRGPPGIRRTVVVLSGVLGFAVAVTVVAALVE